MTVKIGDRVVVTGWGFDFPIKIKTLESEGTNTKLVLDWGPHVESKVYLHDREKVWNLLEDLN